MKSITSAERSYFAGHFDGEGCLSIWGNKSHGFGVHARVQLCYKPTILYYQEFFGGSVYKVKIKSEKHKQAWIWEVCGRTAVARFLIAIEPYGQEKVAQVSLTLNFLTIALDRSPYPKEILDIETQLKFLKKQEFN